ncbi:hypothetical protein KP2022_08975 [Klebsiella pneumoniae]|uniref:hypothetical protein n=1 Tax=Klebsiella pneumoniae TaxID=573 RepID=UPI0021F87103|nr:hypothetical protein [Klebsiella pneumoniae]UYT02330.1 hypothetical protein KP2022_08975 [Klebsiella pneumoniae]
MAFNPELGSSSPEVLLDNAKRLDELTNGPAATVPDRAGEPLDSWRKMQEDNAALVDETRQNLIPLGRQYMTFADAQADIANIPEGSSTYYRSPDDLRLAIEVMNIGGTLEPTGRVMVSKLYIDEIKNRTPNIDRSSYWGGIVAADGTIGVTFRKSDNEPILGKYGALSALTSSLTPFADIASGMATVNINSSFLVVANGTDGLSVPTIFNKITSTMFVKLFAVTTDEQVADIGRRSGYWGGIVAKNGLVGMVFRESDNRPIFGGGGERGGDIFSRLEAVENSGGIVIKKSHTAGDSTGAGTGAPAGYSFPDQLAALIGDGFVAINYSIGGQKSEQVAMRMGAKPIYLTVNGDLIPASGGSVAITQINGVSATAEPPYPSQDVRFLSTPSNTTTYTLDGWISGIKCRVTRTSSGGVETYNLTALSGAGFRCLPGSLFVPEYAMQDHSDSEMWICVGINDFRSGATTAADYDADVAAIKTNIDALVSQAEKSGRPILVYGINTCNYPPVELLGGIRYQRILEVNQYLSQKYPGYYVRGSNGRDLREELVSRYNASIAQDVTDFGNDIVPSSLRSDPRHPNATGYGVYAEFGYQTRQRRG